MVGALVLSLAYFAGAVGVWWQLTGRFFGSADTVRKEQSIVFGTQDDWQKGSFTGTKAENGTLRLGVSQTTSVPTSALPANAPSQTVATASAWKKKSDSTAAASCTALVPDAYWELHPGDISGELDRVHKQWAGYSVLFVNTPYQAAAPLQAAPFNDPDLYSADQGTAAKAWGRLVLSTYDGPGDLDTSPLEFTSELNDQIGDYSLRSVESNLYRGVVFYHSQGYPSDLGYGYFLPVRWAFTKKADWAKDGAKVAQIAASLKCTLSGRSLATSSASASVTRGGSDGASSDSNGSDAGYNPWLGTEYVHDTNGNNYLVDPSSQWSTTGPQGGGYYIPTSGGNSYELLSPGRVD